MSNPFLDEMPWCDSGDDLREPPAPKRVCPHCLGICNPLPEGSGYCDKCKGTGWDGAKDEA